MAACPYLATALHALVIVPSPAVGTMGVDRHWRCYVSPAFVAATELRDLAFVWLHEVAHLVREHHRRAEALMEQARRQAAAPDGAATALLDPTRPVREQLRLNLAMDCEINDDLTDSIPDAAAHGLRRPHSAITPDRLNIPRRELFEQYLREIPATALFGEAAWLDCGSGAHGGASPWELDGAGAKPGLTEHETAVIRIRVREAIRRGRGTAPAGWRRWADGIGESAEDWRTLLGGAFRSCLTAAGGAADYTYRRPGRRTQALGGAVVLPSLRRPLPQVAAVIDTSGSVSDGDLAAALGEVAAISRSVGVQGNRLNVHSCDAAVHTVQQICRAEEIALVGGGGTDLRRGIARAVSGTPRPDVIVVLTDGMTPWPQAHPGSRVVAGIFGRPRRFDDEGERLPGPPDWIQAVYLH